MALTAATAVGAELRLGPPVGALRLDMASGRDILMVAGSTGLAPLKSMLEQVACLRQPPPGAPVLRRTRRRRTVRPADLEKLAAEHPWLTVVPAVSAAAFAGEHRPARDVVTRYGNWTGHDAYLAGPTEMVQDTAATAGRERECRSSDTRRGFRLE